jgi:hypothetical protein
MDRKIILMTVIAILILCSIIVLFTPSRTGPKSQDEVGSTTPPISGEPGPGENATNESNEPKEPEAPGPEGVYNPQLNPQDFTAVVTNKYLTLTPGMNFIFEGETEDGTEHIEVYVTNETKQIMGITAIVVWDRVWLEGDLIEETKDWYAQDKEGNVWYLGEDSKELVDGKIVGTEGSWEFGVDSAKPGIVMKADPQVGDSYRQEYLKGKAEDMGDVVSLNESVAVPHGSFKDCLKTRDWTPLEPGADEYKYYCPEVGGVVLEIVTEDGGKTELINITTVTEGETPKTEPPQEEFHANITEDQAKAIALAAVEGTVKDVAVEKKFGKTTYVVEMQTIGGEVDVIINIETGEILAIED